MIESDEDKMERWLRKILTFKHSTRDEARWYVNELTRRFRWPRDIIAAIFKQEGMF